MGRPGGAGRWRYTRLVARWLRSVASLLTVVIIAGTPAVLSACVALCRPGMEASAVELAAPACAEHQAAAMPVQADGRMSGNSGHCCADGLTAPAPSITASRASHLLVATVSPSRLSWTQVARSTLVTARPDVTGPPPSPPRTSAVLRI
jgi:hypothetical protein